MLTSGAAQSFALVPSPPKENPNNSTLSTGSNPSSYLSRMSFVKFQRNPPPAKQAPPDPPINGGHHVSFSDPPATIGQCEHLPAAAGSWPVHSTQQSVSDKLHMQYLNVKLDNMKDLVEDTSQLNRLPPPSVDTQPFRPQPLLPRREEHFMPLVSDTSNGSSLGGTGRVFNKTEEMTTFSPPKPTIPSFRPSHPPGGFVKPESLYPSESYKLNIPPTTTGVTGVINTGIVRALDLSGTELGDTDSLMGMLKEIKKNTANSTLNSTAISMGSKRVKSAKTRLFEPTASFTAKTVVSDSHKWQERTDKLCLAKAKQGAGKQSGKAMKGKPVSGYDTTQGPNYSAFEKQKTIPDKIFKKASPKFPNKDQLLDVSTAIAHYSTNQSNNNLDKDTVPASYGHNDPGFLHSDGHSPFKSYQGQNTSVQSENSADALILESRPEEQHELESGDTPEIPRLSKSHSFSEGLDISAITGTVIVYCMFIQYIVYNIVYDKPT